MSVISGSCPCNTSHVVLHALAFAQPLNESWDDGARSRRWWQSHTMEGAFVPAWLYGAEFSFCQLIHFSLAPVFTAHPNLIYWLYGIKSKLFFFFNSWTLAPSSYCSHWPNLASSTSLHPWMLWYYLSTFSCSLSKDILYFYEFFFQWGYLWSSVIIYVCAACSFQCSIIFLLFLTNNSTFQNLAPSCLQLHIFLQHTLPSPCVVVLVYALHFHGYATLLCMPLFSHMGFYVFHYQTLIFFSRRSITLSFSEDFSVTL